MLIIRCTQKLLKKLDVPENELTSDNAVSISPLGNWHANVIGVSRYHGIIFVNDATLFSFVVFNVPKSALQKDLPRVFNYVLCEALRSEGFSVAWINKVSEISSVFKVGRSASRKVLGNINDLIYHYEFYILREGGVKECDMQKIIRDINRMPQRNIGWKYSIEAMKMLANEPFHDDKRFH